MRSALLRYAYSFSRRSYEHSEVEFRYNTKNYTGKLISETVEIDKSSYSVVRRRRS